MLSKVKRSELYELYLELLESPMPERHEHSEFDDPTFRITNLLLTLEELIKKGDP